MLLLGIDVPLRSGICTAAWYKTGVRCGILFERPDTGNVRYVCMGVMLIRRVIWVCVLLKPVLDASMTMTESPGAAYRSVCGVERFGMSASAIRRALASVR